MDVVGRFPLEVFILLPRTLYLFTFSMEARAELPWKSSNETSMEIDGSEREARRIDGSRWKPLNVGGYYCGSFRKFMLDGGSN